MGLPEFKADPITDCETLLKNAEQLESRMEILILETQKIVCDALEGLDGKAKFKVDRWMSGEKSGGIMCALSEGHVFEKAGVTVSVMRGQLSESTASHFNKRQKGVEAGMPYFAAGISSVIHPLNPHCPTMHFNYRLFEVSKPDGSTCAWFGGGTDLTPFVLNEEDAVHFHTAFKGACDQHNAGYYPRFKKWCDEYFFIKHRGEARGVGGIFFDDVDGPNLDDVFKFVKTCTETIVPAYIPVISKHKDDGYSEDQRDWQLIRRGRYAEFNLVYDRGTQFGLLTPGTRIESILVSMPPLCKWRYCDVREEGSDEAKLLEVLRKPKDWI
ncbi:hypothetical protein CAPTEDRAFT_160634 [Capitella teleta]|uniref:coproporphyrinogen oxidase n=1 Tax=Capitella teleta TaxID=283909 RepID=R7V8N4_CAPTE|nr:hypothetical protein CAPTEDRAFT_160634 [Capitella teleta]|eukprot:ELU12701.1 hypothetical protein CAPTEDRAFT_160634 [Capitella teleta]